MKNWIFPLILLLFILPFFSFRIKEVKKVTIVAFGEVKSSDWLTVKKALRGYYKLKMEELIIEDIPPQLYINRTDTLSGASVLNYLQNINPNTDGFVIAITPKALSLGKGGFTIRGLASSNLYSGVISTAKLRLECESEDEFKANLIKVSRHEYGHMLGLPHCEFSDSCLMIPGHDRKDFFLKMKPKLCSKCQERVVFSLK